MCEGFSDAGAGTFPGVDCVTVLSCDALLLYCCLGVHLLHLVVEHQRKGSCGLCYIQASCWKTYSVKEKLRGSALKLQMSVLHNAVPLYWIISNIEYIYIEHWNIKYWLCLAIFTTCFVYVKKGVIGCIFVWQLGYNISSVTASHKSLHLKLDLSPSPIHWVFESNVFLLFFSFY